MALNAARPTGGVKGVGFVKAGNTQSIAQWKQFFFDRPAVVKAAGRAKTAALARFAGYVRSVARRSMRRRKKGVSAPGTPPFAKSGELRDLLFFGYDAKSGTFVVGPLGFKGSAVPALHEHGGVAPAYGFRTLAGKAKRVVTGTARYPKRPFMAPALKVSLPKFAQSFKGTVSR
jgi:hypothetical protein